MKFYPTDWVGEPSLRICSIGARGLWMEMICLMHQAEPCGSLVINGKQVTSRQLAALSGVPFSEIESLLAELEDAGVFGRDADGTIFSRRIRRDEAKAKADRDNGSKGGNPNLTKGVNHPNKGGDKAQKPKARDQNPDPEKEKKEEETRAKRASLAQEFENQFWPKYPHKIGKPDALRKWFKARERAALPTILGGLMAYVSKTDDRPWCNPATWLNQDRWADAPSGAGPPPDIQNLSIEERKARYLATFLKEPANAQ